MKRYAGFLLFHLYLNFSLHFKYAIDRVINNLGSLIHSSPTLYSLEKIFYMMVGYVCSGKSRLVQDPPFDKCLIISENEIHDALDKIPFFNGAVGSIRFFAREAATCYISKLLLVRAFRLGITTVNDACNLRYAWRRKILKLAKLLGYETRIIYAHDGEAHFLKQAGPHAEKVYWEIQARHLEAPEPWEADSFADYNSLTGIIKERKNPAVA